MTELRRSLATDGSIGEQPDYYIAAEIARWFGFPPHDWPNVPRIWRDRYLAIWNATQNAARDRVKHKDTLARFAGR